MPDDVARWRLGEPNNSGGEEHFVSVKQELAEIYTYSWNDEKAVINTNKGVACEQRTGKILE